MEEPVNREQWGHLALFASLTTAADVTFSIRERLAGRDPSTQEADGAALSYLSDAVPAFRHLLLRLRLLLFGREDGEEGTSSVLRRFPELMLLLRASRLLHRIHQRMLSLYPSVSEEALEEVRLLENGIRRLLQGRTRGFDQDVAGIIERGLILVEGGFGTGMSRGFSGNGA